jgi:thiamine biosynthesis lipoprotein
MRTASFAAIGTTARIAVTDDSALGFARDELARRLALLDASCSRFRPKSELSRANERAGRLVVLSPLLAELVAVALAAARSTCGLVDPTLGRAMRAAGYDRTFALVRARGRWTVAEPHPGQWADVRLDGRTLRAPRGVELDLGATAKAWAADDAAGAIAVATGAGVLVSLGGDIAVAGTAPDGGWPVRIADDHAAPSRGDPVVAIEDGGLATSSTTVRRWDTTEGEAHHLLDPVTGRPAAGHWRTVTVAASTCVGANVAATAAIVLSRSARPWLDRHRLPARLVARDGRVTTTSGWPET